MQKYFPILQLANEPCCCKCNTGPRLTGPHVWPENLLPLDCFEEDTLFVEDSFAINSLNDCFEACTATTCCEVFYYIDILYVGRN